jgi:CheY-like chemotaxis protein
VLVVDDDEMMRQLMITSLGRSGYRTLSAADGEEALHLLADEAVEIDLLLTDIIMPGRLDGFALARAALALRPGLRLLYISGFVRNLHNEPDSPPALLLKKPCHPATLRAEVAAALQQAA